MLFRSLEDISSSLDDLHYASVDSYKAQGVNIHTNSTVTDLDTDNKTVVEIGRASCRERV